MTSEYTEPALLLGIDLNLVFVLCKGDYTKLQENKICYDALCGTKNIKTMIVRVDASEMSLLCNNSALLKERYDYLLC